MIFSAGESEISIDNFEVTSCIINGYIKYGIINGASYYVSNNKGLYTTGAIGNKTILSKKGEENTINTLYDIGALIEVVVTTPLLCILETNGTINFDDKIIKYIPDFYYHDITIRDLLTNKITLVTNLVKDNESDQKNFLDLLLHPAISKSDNNAATSMTNFIILGMIIEKATNQTLDIVADQFIFKPLGMKHTSFNPNDGKDNPNSSNIFTFERNIIRGHTGLFSNPIDLSHFTKMILNNGIVNGKIFIPQKYIDDLFIPTNVGSIISGNMGWTIDCMKKLFCEINENFICKINCNNDIILLDKENGIAIIILFDSDDIIDINMMISLVNNIYKSMLELKEDKRKDFKVYYTN